MLFVELILGGAGGEGRRSRSPIAPLEAEFAAKRAFRKLLDLGTTDTLWALDAKLARLLTLSRSERPWCDEGRFTRAGRSTEEEPVVTAARAKELPLVVRALVPSLVVGREAETDDVLLCLFRPLSREEFDESERCISGRAERSNLSVSSAAGEPSLGLVPGRAGSLEAGSGLCVLLAGSILRKLGCGSTLAVSRDVETGASGPLPKGPLDSMAALVALLLAAFSKR